jgi:hypothetical protein
MRLKHFSIFLIFFLLSTFLLYYYKPFIFQKIFTKPQTFDPKCLYFKKRDLYVDPILLLISPKYSSNLHLNIQKKKLSQNCDIDCFVTSEINNETIQVDAFISESTESKEEIVCANQKTVLYTQENVQYHGFDFYMDTKLTSDVTVGYFSSDFDFMRKPQIKKEIMASAFISNCWYKDETQRIEILKKLKQFGVTIDSYGECENSIKEDTSDLKTRENRKLDLIANYKFFLAFETIQKQDFVSEKFFQALQMGTVPGKKFPICLISYSVCWHKFNFEICTFPKFVFAYKKPSRYSTGSSRNHETFQ